MPPKKPTRRTSKSNSVSTRSASRASRSNDCNFSDRGRNRQDDIVDVFNEFRSVFESEERSSEPEATSNTSNTSSSEPEEVMETERSVERPVHSEEMPSWARELIDTQQKAIEYNNRKLYDLRKEIRSLKRKRSKDEDEDFEWKKKGHKKQYEFNRSIEEQFEEIATANELLPARVAAEKGMELIKERNKLLKIADTHGWDTVNQYVSDPLAANERDDKKLRKAIKDAEKAREKAKSQKEAKARRSGRARTFPKESAFSPSRLGPPVNTGTNQRVILPTLEKKSARFNCFRCGKPGHMMRDCTSLSNSSNTNI